MDQQPTIGRIVIVRLPNGYERPAIVTNASGGDRIVALTVFLDPGCDVYLETIDYRIIYSEDRMFAVMRDVPYSETNTYSWHWPTREPVDVMPTPTPSFGREYVT